MTIQQAAQILELAIPFSKDELKQAYRESLLIWHPDRFETSSGLKAKAESKTVQIVEAYVVLSRQADLDSQHTNFTEDHKKYQPPSRQTSDTHQERRHQSSSPSDSNPFSTTMPGIPRSAPAFKGAVEGRWLKLSLLPFQLFTPICLVALIVANEVLGYPIRDLMYLKKGILVAIPTCFFVLCIGGTFQRFISPTKDYVYTWVSVFVMMASGTYIMDFFRSTH
ncbi:MAG: J domain-containing protein [Verrucomicrobia bacterium]|nr:J domain-containing protein [Verrucomicrobiota bacterium]